MGSARRCLRWHNDQLFSPSFESQNELADYTDFVQTYNPDNKFNKNIINNSLNDFHNNSLKNAFQGKKPLLATSHAKLLQNLLFRTRFGLVSTPRASPKVSDFTTAKIKGAFYITTIMLTLVKNLNLNINLEDVILGNRTVYNTPCNFHKLWRHLYWRNRMPL